MQIPLIQQTQLPTAQAEQVKSLAGERVSPKQIPKTEAARWSQVKQTADKAFDISIQMEQAEAQEEYQRKLLELKDGFARIDTDIKTNPIYKEMSIKGIEETHGEMSDELQSRVLSSTEHHLAKKTVMKEGKNMSIGSRVKAKGVAYANTIDRGRAGTVKSLEAYSNSFVKDGNIDDLARGEAAINGGVAAGFYSKQEGVTMLKAFNNAAISGYYDSLIKTSPLQLHEQVIVRGEEPAAWRALTESVKTQLKEGIKAGYNKHITKTKIAVVGSWQNDSLDDPVSTWKSFTKIPRKHFSELNNQEYASLKRQIKMNYKSATTTGKQDPVLIGKVNRDIENSLSSAKERGIEDQSVKEKIYQAYPDKRKAQAVHEQYLADLRKSYIGFNSTQEIKSGSIAENELFLDITKPTLGLGDFKSRQEEYEAADKEFNYKTKTLDEDPKRLYNEYMEPKKRPMSADPAVNIENTAKDMVDLTSWYKRQGVPESKWSVLTKDEATAFANSIADKPAFDIVNDIKNITGLYGNMSKYTFRDLSKAGLPMELRLISELKPEQMETIGIDLATAAKFKEKDLVDMFGTDSNNIKKTIDENIEDDDKISNFIGSVFNTSTEKPNFDIVKKFTVAAKKLAYTYKLKGYDEETAANKATEALLGGKFEYIEQYDGRTIRLKPSQDLKAAERAMALKIDELNTFGISRRYSDPTISPTLKKYNEDIMVENLKSKGSVYWKNGTGEYNDNLVLTNSMTGLAIFNNNELPITIDLNNLASETIPRERPKITEEEKATAMLEGELPKLKEWVSSVTKAISTAKDTSYMLDTDFARQSPLSDDQLAIIRTKDKRQRAKIKKWLRDNISVGKDAKIAQKIYDKLLGD